MPPICLGSLILFKGSSLLRIWPFPVTLDFDLFFSLHSFSCLFYFIFWLSFVPICLKIFFSHFINFWPWVFWDSTPLHSSGTGANISRFLDPWKLSTWMHRLLLSWVTVSLRHQHQWHYVPAFFHFLSAFPKAPLIVFDAIFLYSIIPGKEISSIPMVSTSLCAEDFQIETFVTSLFVNLYSYISSCL